MGPTAFALLVRPALRNWRKTCDGCVKNAGRSSVLVRSEGSLFQDCWKLVGLGLNDLPQFCLVQNHGLAVFKSYQSPPSHVSKVH